MGRTFDTGFLRNVVAYDASGNVGLGGAVDATYKLKVTGAMQVTGAATFSSSVTAGSNILINNSGTTIPNIGATSSQGGLNFYSGATADYNGGAQITLVSSDRSGAYTRGEIYISAGRATNNTANGFIALYTSDTERMRITSGGNVFIGYSSWSIDTHYIGKGTNQGDFIVYLGGSGARYGNTATFQTVDYQGWNAAAAGLKVGWNSGNSRSINTYGTINTGGSDYAEYMQKETDDENKKGDIVGVNANGKLTNIFNDAVSFVVKSTNPSFVGGDTWGSDIDDDDILETERHKVDRIAFSGQVPCNVLGANVGDYIIPVEKNGKISGQAVTNPTFEQYQLSVGKVWKIMEDGRAWIAVKIG